MTVTLRLDRMWALIHSIRFRLMLWFGLILGLVLLVFSSYVYSTQARASEDNTITQLQGDLKKLAGSWVTTGELPSTADVLKPLIADREIAVLVNTDGGVVETLGPVPGGAQGAHELVTTVAEYERTLSVIQAEGDYMAHIYLTGFIASISRARPAERLNL